jgi:hypothetical protein
MCVDLWMMRNVADIQCCQFLVFNTNEVCLGYGGKLAIANIGIGNTITVATLSGFENVRLLRGVYP